MPLNMINKFSRRIEFKLTLWYTVIFIVSWIMLLYAGFFILETSILSKDRQIILGLMDNYTLVAKTKGEAHLIGELQQETPGHIKEGLFIMVADVKRNVQHITRPYGWPEFSRNELEGLFRFEPGDRWKYFKTDRYRPMDIIGPHDDELEIKVVGLPGGGRLWLGHSSEYREEYLENFRDIFLSVMIIAVLSSVFTGIFMAWRAMAPVRALEKTVDSVVSGQMEARISLKEKGGELGGLTMQFNKMLDRIEGLIKAMGDALDNVAHDLRTPLTRMGIAIERNAMENDPERLKEALFDCAEEAQRISGMLTILMDISEAETGIMALSFVQVDLTALFDEIIDIYEYAANEKEISLVASTPHDLTLTADHNRLRQVMCNLVDNAIKYSPAGTQVDIVACAIDKSVEIRVIDMGVGIAPEESEKIFDRLYRCDQSRNTKGSGLGLSLVKAVVSAHKGCVSVQSNGGKGSVFLLSFPFPSA